MFKWDCFLSALVGPYPFLNSRQGNMRKTDGPNPGCGHHAAHNYLRVLHFELVGRYASRLDLSLSDNTSSPHLTKISTATLAMIIEYINKK